MNTSDGPARNHTTTRRTPERQRIAVPDGFGIEDATPLFDRPKFLIAIAIAALPAGYFFIFENSDRADKIAVAPQATTDMPPIGFLPLRKAEVPSVNPITVQSRVQPEAQMASLQPPERLEVKSTESGIEA